MVSVNPNPGQGFYFFDNPMNMGLTGLNSLPPPTTTASTTTTTTSTTTGAANPSTASFLDDPSKKIRKPYTITKSRESWTEQEHDKFLEALQLFDRDWKKIEAFVGSKTVIQIRSHAQKYFLKVQKNGASEHVPPPRPKRKASHPYPQKAPKNVVSQATGPYQSSSAMLEPAYIYQPDTSSVPGNPVTSSTLSSWNFNSTPPVGALQVTKDDAGLAGPTIAQNCCYSSSNESTRRTWPRGEKNDRGDHSKPEKVMPDFAQVYSFIGSVFDPNATGHMQRLKQMERVNLETVLLLMRNLSVNLASPEFEDHRRLLSLYDADPEKPKSGTSHNDPCTDQSHSTILSA
ncbi:protein REVEILLE 3 isoform X1 [Alnus glutinosa]|uniref:protein REVEILLE 3 isoform X1 n=1 Tax=Alnus glutinosa TaxID=3517 RepID=UPI002D78FE3C|nr:protein REVEILLE 3 isoform X1 [Alnus glutinosa]